jgi:hypothetical protein
VNDVYTCNIPYFSITLAHLQVIFSFRSKSAGRITLFIFGGTSNKKIRLFADDCIIYKKILNIKDVEKLIGGLGGRK